MPQYKNNELVEKAKQDRAYNPKKKVKEGVKKERGLFFALSHDYDPDPWLEPPVYEDVKFTDWVKTDDGQKWIENYNKEEQKKSLEEVWENRPLFDKVLLDLAFPVSQQYAKNHYNEINDAGDLSGPLAFDIASNVAMPAYGKTAGRFTKIFQPFITEAGNVGYNDENLGEAIAKGTLGATMNAMSNAVKPVWNGSFPPVPGKINRRANDIRHEIKIDPNKARHYSLEHIAKNLKQAGKDGKESKLNYMLFGQPMVRETKDKMPSKMVLSVLNDPNFDADETYKTMMVPVDFLFDVWGFHNGFKKRVNYNE